MKDFSFKQEIVHHLGGPHLVVSQPPSSWSGLPWLSNQLSRQIDEPEGDCMIACSEKRPLGDEAFDEFVREGDVVALSWRSDQGGLVERRIVDFPLRRLKPRQFPGNPSRRKQTRLGGSVLSD
jgi:hypothetical protein